MKDKIQHFEGLKLASDTASEQQRQHILELRSRLLVAEEGRDVATQQAVAEAERAGRERDRLRAELDRREQQHTSRALEMEPELELLRKECEELRKLYQEAKEEHEAEV